MKTEEEKEMLVLVELEDFLKRCLSLTQVIQIFEPDLYKALCSIHLAKEPRKGREHSPKTAIAPP